MELVEQFHSSQLNNRCVLPELVKEDCVTIPFCRKLLMMADFPTALPPNILTMYLVGSLHLPLSDFLSFVYPGGDFSNSGQRGLADIRGTSIQPATRLYGKASNNNTAMHGTARWRRARKGMLQGRRSLRRHAVHSRPGRSYTPIIPFPIHDAVGWCRGLCLWRCRSEVRICVMMVGICCLNMVRDIWWRGLRVSFQRLQLMNDLRHKLFIICVCSANAFIFIITVISPDANMWSAPSVWKPWTLQFRAFLAGTVCTWLALVSSTVQAVTSDCSVLI